MFRTLVIGLLLIGPPCFAQDTATLELTECGTLLRPLNPADPQSMPLELSVAVVPALSLEPEPDPLVLIAGGPGQASITFYAAWASAFERVRRNRDILLIDQRGTGQSAALSCDIEDAADGQLSTEETIAAVSECLEVLPYDPRFFTTSVAVTDLEALRVALGYPLLNVYGISYGTRVAQHFARRHPDSVRTLILDGVVPPQIALGPEIATESQLAVERVLARCADDSGCHERFPDIYADFMAVQQQLEASPPTVVLPDPLTGRPENMQFDVEKFALAIRLLLYNQRTIALLPLLVHEAANGNYLPLAAQFQMTVTDLSESLSIGMHNAVMCTEDIPFVDDDKVDHDALASSYLGPMQLEALQTICSIWPAGVLDDGFKAPLATDLPVLLLSGDADPITPERFATLAAVDLDNAWLLTGKNQGHGQAPVGCMPRLISEFINKESLADVDTSCVATIFSMPFFLDFSGPAP